jgi:DNA polymerase III sliding clamp (beta) subunit (PCNA family)
MVMPKNNDQIANFDLDEMRSAVRRMSLIADDRNRSIRLTVREGEVEVTAQSSEHGEGNEIVQADYKGEEMTLGFNWQYLLEFLSNVGSVEMIAAESETETEVKETEGDKVRVRDTSAPKVTIAFEFKDPNAQTQLSIAGETTYDYKYIVMPLRI